MELFYIILVLLIYGNLRQGLRCGAAWIIGFNNCDAAAIGIAMKARGDVELVIADIALRVGVFPYPIPLAPFIEHLFSAVVIMAVATTLLPL